MFFEGLITGVEADQRKIYALFEIAYTLVDFLAAMAFTVGSILFLYEDWQTVATWGFIVGSLFFALKPTLRIIRELKLAAMGQDEKLADELIRSE